MYGIQEFSRDYETLMTLYVLTSANRIPQEQLDVRDVTRPYSRELEVGFGARDYV